MQDLQRPLQNVAEQRRQELLPVVYAHTGGQVCSGPFRGMYITPNYMWGDGDTASKLLGQYENELYAYIEKIVAFEPDVIVNVGSAEGFYAVGLAKATGARVVAADVEKSAQQITELNASANNVQVETMGAVDTQVLKTLIEPDKKTVLLLDCEGYENTLLDLDTVPELKDCWILAETHDVFNRGLTQRLQDRFQNTHKTVRIDQATKDPYSIPWLANLSDSDKWCLVMEGRPEMASWLWMEPV